MNPRDYIRRGLETYPDHVKITASVDQEALYAAWIVETTVKVVQSAYEQACSANPEIKKVNPIPSCLPDYNEKFAKSEFGVLILGEDLVNRMEVNSISKIGDLKPLFNAISDSMGELLQYHYDKKANIVTLDNEHVENLIVEKLNDANLPDSFYCLGESKSMFAGLNAKDELGIIMWCVILMSESEADIIGWAD